MRVRRAFMGSSVCCIVMVGALCALPWEVTVSSRPEPNVMGFSREFRTALDLPGGWVVVGLAALPAVGFGIAAILRKHPGWRALLAILGLALIVFMGLLGYGTSDASISLYNRSREADPFKAEGPGLAATVTLACAVAGAIFAWSGLRRLWRACQRA